MKKLIVLMLSLFLVISPITAMAEVGGTTTKSILEFSDMPEDWSTAALLNAIENGLLTGFEGKIMPKENLTRAEMATVINRAFGATEKASINMFTDVKPSDWFYDEMAKAIQMKTFKGSGQGLNPNAPITREEAFLVLTRAIKLGSTDSIPAGFLDLDNISDWAKGEVYSLLNAGYISGSNGYINPNKNITRAEFAQVMNNILSSYVNKSGEYTTLPEGNVMLNVAGVTLKNLTIAGDLVIGDGVGDGDVTLDNVTVTGRMVVRGGGENSIIIKGQSNLGQIIVARVDGAVRIFTETGSIVESIYVDDGEDRVILEGNIETLVVQSNVPIILVNANVENITVESINSQITVDEDSSVDNLLISSTATGTSINVEGKVNSIVTEAPKTTIEGTGTVTAVEVKEGASDTNIETPETKITVQDGVTGTTGTGGVAIEEGTTVENNKDITKAPIVEKEDTPSTGGSGSSTTALRLISASLGDNDVTVDGNDITVEFDLGTVPGTIIANFNKAVTIKEIKTNVLGLVSFSDVEDKVGSNLPSTSSKLTLPISTIITQNHLTVFGDEVIVTVRANNGDTETYTINLIGINK